MDLETVSFLLHLLYLICVLSTFLHLCFQVLHRFTQSGICREHRQHWEMGTLHPIKQHEWARHSEMACAVDTLIDWHVFGLSSEWLLFAGTLPCCSQSRHVPSLLQNAYRNHSRNLIFEGTKPLLSFPKLPLTLSNTCHSCITCFSHYIHRWFQHCSSCFFLVRCFFLFVVSAILIFLIFVWIRFSCFTKPIRRCCGKRFA